MLFLLLIEINFKEDLDQQIDFNLRITYIAVKAVAKHISVILNILILDINIFSKIKCFEKKALMKGAPIRHNLLILNITRHKGILTPTLPSIRISWFPKLHIKILPAAKNNNALNSAWAYK